MDRLQRILERGPVLLDGAMGTALAERSKSRPDLHCPEELNLIRPELVRELHAQYIAAGAQIIETNSFGGNRLRLAEYGLDQQMTQINRRAAELAVESRQSINHEVLVAGSIGPLGQLIAPLGSISQANAEEIYREQIDALISGGVELLILETYTSLAELELAVRVARQIAPHLPVIAAMSFDQATPEAAQAMVQAMRPWPLAALGANCGSGPEQAIQIVGQLVEAGAAVVIAFPNAGLPQRLAGRLHYSGRPEYFANAARQLIAAGARLVGGCCGTGPVHTAAMRQALEERRGSNRGGTSQLQSASLSSTPPTNTAAASSTLPPRGEESMVSGGIYGGSRLAAQLQGDRAVFSVELRPPRGINPKRMLQRARQMRQAGVEFANLTDSAMARLRMGVLGSAALVQQQTELEAIAHYTTRDRNMLAIQSELISAHALGIRNILCLRGDAPRIGDYPNATAVWDVTSVGLITILANLNRGLDANGSPIGECADFCIGAAFNPHAENMRRERTLLQRKLEAGAHFVVTNPLFELTAMERCLEALADIKLPVLVGVMPLISARQANYLHHEVPGMTIPERIRRQIESAGEDADKIGLELALELLAAGRGIVRGAYIVPGGERYDIAIKLIGAARGLLSPTLHS